jgi:hypothetical protein
MTAGAHHGARWIRRLSTGLLWTIALVLLGASIAICGVHLLGGVREWNGWLSQHRLLLLGWRLLLYVATLTGWCWMRQRLLVRESGVAARSRLQRTELAALIAIAALECTTWLNGW